MSDSQPHKSSTKGAVAGSAVAAAIAIAISIIAPFEGKHNDPYYDIVRVRTVCYGETRVPMRRYSDTECSEMLRAAVARDFAPAVFACVPGLRSRPGQAAASISLAYNIGTAGFCRSTVARKMKAGDWVGGCHAIALYNRAGGKVVRGLTNRRAAEVALCLKGVNR
jgi:lysozyme